MAVMSIIPAFGTAIIWLPALIILALSGDFFGVAILAVLCGAVAGNLDNVIRPRLVGKDTEMHDLFVLFGTLGGISMFGLLGIIIGPIVAALFITIWEIYGKAFEGYLPDVGPIFSSQGKRGTGRRRFQPLARDIDRERDERGAFPDFQQQDPPSTTGLTRARWTLPVRVVTAGVYNSQKRGERKWPRKFE